MHSPKVSIVIPVYNGADFLGEAIDSALAQTYPNVEVIVVNDGSCDGGKTREIALAYGDAIRYFAKENGGVASALNLGIEKMQGEYVSWLSHDDVFYPDKIAVQISCLATQESPDTILYGDYDIIDAKSQTTGFVDIEAPLPGHMRYALTVRYPLHGCTTLIPRRCFETGGMFNEELRTTQDYDLWFRFAGLFPFVHQAKRLIQSRHHEGQGTNTMQGLHQREVDQLFGRFVQELTPEEVADATGTPAPYAYAAIADSFYARGALSATSLAHRCAWQALVSLSLGQREALRCTLLMKQAKNTLRGWWRRRLIGENA